MIAKFMDVSYVKQNTIIDDNVDNDLIEKFIRISQDLNIQQMLGNNLYVKLQNDIVNNALTGFYYNLVVDYVMPAQAQWVIWHIIPFINYRLTNINVAKKNSDNSQPAEVSELQYIRENQRNTAEFYNQRIREYIINNLNSFPEYSQSFGIDVIRPKRTTYFNGIYTSDDCGCSTPYGRDNGDNLRWVL